MAPSQESPSKNSRSRTHEASDITASASTSASASAPSSDAADLAQTYRDLIRGEQAASALEANLSNLETKLNAMLAAVETAEEDGKLEGGKKPVEKEGSR
ncbi:hypothetical protein G7046_g12 [Stylonectria norvegica]|nr:hypothetical protein G7046_g12 [Stylonectria norvegica]